MKKLLVILLTFSMSSFAELKESDVVKSSLKNFPSVLEALENVEAAQNKVMESYGAFDTKLKVKSDQRSRGYYDGKSTDVLIEKPLPFLNSKIYTGYRVSDGKFPVYEGKNNTLDEGEVRGGIGFSLWQNRDIDENRLKLWNNKLNLSSKELKALMTKIKIQKEAAKAYWTWVAKGNVYYVYKGLLKIAIERNEAIKKRVARGDLAKIYETENMQYIVKRRNQVVKSERDFFESSLYLSLFYRDKEGETIFPDFKLLPKEFPQEVKIGEDELKKSISEAIELNPELKRMDLEIAEYKNKEKFGLNKLSPKFDVNFEFSRDDGIGDPSLQNTENRVLFKIEIPIERNLGRGKVEQARVKQRVTRLRKKLLADNIKVDIWTVFYRTNAAVDSIFNTDKEIELSTELQKAEVKKFKSGASDYFVVNLREQNMADAKIKNIKAHYDYRKARAEYNALISLLLRK